jgi:hypothetical protein
MVLLQPPPHTLVLLLLLLGRELCGTAPCCACDVKDVGVVPMVGCHQPVTPVAETVGGKKRFKTGGKTSGRCTE